MKRKILVFIITSCIIVGISFIFPTIFWTINSMFHEVNLQAVATDHKGNIFILFGHALVILLWSLLIASPYILAFWIANNIIVKKEAIQVTVLSKTIKKTVIRHTVVMLKIAYIKYENMIVESYFKGNDFASLQEGQEITVIVKTAYLGKKYFISHR